MIVKLLFLHFMFMFFVTSSSLPTSPLNFTISGNNCISNTPKSNVQRVSYTNRPRLLDSSFNSTAKEENETGISKNPHKDKWVLQLTIGSLALNFILFLLIVALVLFYIFVTKRRNQMQDLIELGHTLAFHEKRIPRRLELSAIRSATKGFREDQIISEWRYATGGTMVYRANLPPYGAVAVKRIPIANIIASFGTQFASEFTTMVGSLTHKNLLQLRGWCCDETQLTLVYDYMVNKSLNELIHSRETETPSKLNFGTRLNILLGISSAMIYLHEECNPRPFFHRIITANNIMLDADFIPKIGSVGTAKLAEMAGEEVVPRGGLGRTAPEYVVYGVPTVKSDVYMFGVLVLEVASGRGLVVDNGELLTDWVWDLWEKKEILLAADCKLIGKFDGKRMEEVLMTGLICIHPDCEMRPTMKEAMQMLRGELVPDLPATKPTVRIRPVNFYKSAGRGPDL